MKKHNKSRRPASWRNDNITQSKDEATNQIKQIRTILLEHLSNEGPDKMTQAFYNIAQTESDCSSAQKGGDLGFFGRGDKFYLMLKIILQ